MRYSDRSGGLSAPERDRREALRFQAADMFTGKITPPRVAHLLGITRKSAHEWYALRKRGGKAAPASKGAAGTGRKLTAEQLDQLTTLIRNHLKPLRYWLDLLAGFITETRLVIFGPA